MLPSLLAFLAFHIYSIRAALNVEVDANRPQLSLRLRSMRCIVEHNRISTSIEVLTSIWQRLLHRSSISVEDDFFELGGDPSVGVQLFAEIAKVCGRNLPPLMIYHAPTIARLAALLEEPTTPRFPPLVLLKSGTEVPPVFIAHGLGGSVMQFFQLVRHIQSPHPIYGLQARGMDGVDEPLERIEDMAHFHLPTIKELQPHGPYLFVGYSFGGLVMLEIAQLLSQGGEKIALLAMVDSYPDRRYLALGQRVRLITRLARHHASTVMQLPMRKALSYTFRPSDRRLHLSRDGIGSALYQSPIGPSFTPTMQRVRDSDYVALTRYCPRFYSDKIRFVRAAICSAFPDDPVAVWAILTKEFEVETVPGDHHTILTTHFESLASVLSRYLREAFG